MGFLAEAEEPGLLTPFLVTLVTFWVWSPFQSVAAKQFAGDFFFFGGGTSTHELSVAMALGFGRKSLVPSSNGFSPMHQADRIGVSSKRLRFFWRCTGGCRPGTRHSPSCRI